MQTMSCTSASPSDGSRVGCEGAVVERGKAIEEEDEHEQQGRLIAQRDHHSLAKCPERQVRLRFRSTSGRANSSVGQTRHLA